MRALGVKVRAHEAEAVRQMLRRQGLLRDDLRVRHEGGSIVFPVTAAPVALAPASFDFEERSQRPRDYAQLLPDDLRDAAPRAFDTLGDIVLVKVPSALWERRTEVGAALRAFHDARAVFHDHGVVGEFRTRDLERIAGHGDSRTVVAENGVRLVVDPAQAYFSPRLADERARIVALAKPEERIIDLFAGVAPLGVQLARKGCEVVCVDLNPAAVEMAKQNAARNQVNVECIHGDARDVGPRLAAAARVVANLPHAAKEFLDVTVALVGPGGTLHHHEILARAALEERGAQLVQAVSDLGRKARLENVRHVRDYSADDAHYAFDMLIGDAP